jgi:hypothetical protein
MSSKTKRHDVREIMSRRVDHLKWAQRGKLPPLRHGEKSAARRTRIFVRITSKYDPNTEDAKHGITR